MNARREKMKKHYVYNGICILVISVLALASCLSPLEERAKGIEIQLPVHQIYTLPGEQYYAQVYLLVNRELYPLGNNTVYIEKSLDEEADQSRIVVENIPAGQYILWLGIGTKTANGAFNVLYYYESEEFDLVAGSTTTISCDLLDCPFDKALNILGENINGVVITNIGGTEDLYAAGRKHLYRFAGSYNGPDFTIGTLFDETHFPDYSINSITRGLDYTGGVPNNCLFLSTTSGISKADNTDIYDTFSTNLGEMNILKALAYPDGSNVALFFQRNGGLGGVYQENSSPPTDWVNEDYSDILKDQLVWDFCVTEQYNCGYFATALGALRIQQLLIDTYVEGNEAELMSQAEFFEVTYKGNEIPVISLGYDADPVPADSTLYMGTYEGLFYARVGSATPLSETPQLLEETEGTRVYMVLLNDTYRVYMSQTYLFLQEKVSGDVVSLPFVAGVPGVVSAMDWDGNILVISGSRGVVTLDVDAMFL
jgi:hypothetical protein